MTAHARGLGLEIATSKHGLRARLVSEPESPCSARPAACYRPVIGELSPCYPCSACKPIFAQHLVIQIDFPQKPVPETANSACFLAVIRAYQGYDAPPLPALDPPQGGRSARACTWVPRSHPLASEVVRRLRIRPASPSSGSGVSHERPARHRPPPLRLPARLPVGLRARRRGDRRKPDRARAWRGRPSLHAGGRVRESGALRRAHPSSGPADPAAQARRAEGLRAVRADLRGTRRSTASPRRSSKAEREHGAESVWPYFYAGTMGLVMRDGIERLTHVKRYSRFFGTICVGIAWPGYIAGTGRMSGISPAEMAKSDVVVIWGTNAAATQVNLMTHATRARKEHGAKIVAIDIYPTETMRQADLALQLRPGTDGALACAVMHVALPRRSRRPRLDGALRGRARGARSASPRPHARMGERDHRAHASRRSRLSRRWSGATSARSSASATASRASATARPTCTPRSAFPRSPAPGRTRAAARCMRRAPSTGSTRR